MKNRTFTLFFTLLLSSAMAQDIQVPKVQNSLVTKLTATWCTICGGAAWDNYKTLSTNLGSKALVMAGHSSTSSKLYSPTAAAIIQNFDFVASQPSFFYNATRIGSSGTTVVNTITTNVNNANAQTPLAQSGLLVRFDPGTRELTVQARAEFFSAATGEFSLGLYLLERSVNAEQAARSSNEIHQNVLRTSLFPEVFGQSLANGSITEGTTKGFVTTQVLPTSFNTNNLAIAAIIWRKNGTKQEVVNVNWTSQISASVTSVQDLALLQGFHIAPNILEEQAQVRVLLPGDASQTRLDVFDMHGRLVYTLFKGRLSGGEHQFELSRTALAGAAGQYVLRLRHGSAQASRTFILR